MIARAKPKAETLCIVPDCKRPHDAPRGLCSSCYQSGLKLVHTGQTTWEQLEQLGLARSQLKAESANPLRRAFAAYQAANPSGKQKAIKSK